VNLVRSGTKQPQRIPFSAEDKARLTRLKREASVGALEETGRKMGLDSLLNLPRSLQKRSFGMSLRIAAARLEDCEILFGLIRALADYEKLASVVSGTPEELKRELFGERPVIEAVLAWEGAHALGFALFFHNFSTFLTRRGLYLEDLFVVPGARGRGIGKALIRHGARLAVERGCGRYEWAVLDWNTPAIEFYESIGAIVMPDWRICRVYGEALARLASPTAAS